MQLEKRGVPAGHVQAAPEPGETGLASFVPVRTMTL
jgi:hypothetical protein